MRFGSTTTSYRERASRVHTLRSKVTCAYARACPRQHEIRHGYEFEETIHVHEEANCGIRQIGSS